MSIASLSRGFRERFLDYETLTAQVHAWADAYPDIVRVRSLAKSPEGRDLWLLTIGPEPDRSRPAVWIDGNLHAAELCGSSVALAVAEDVIRLHRGEEVAALGLSTPVKRSLEQVLVYALPRISPDGAEAVLESGRYVRSNPRDDRPNRGHPRWIGADVDGDGRALLMRRADPAGEFVESREVPNMMMPRTVDDPPPYYKIWPEGLIENFDGRNVPNPYFLSDNDTDLNRNFPYSWVAEPEQEGAGTHPGSAPETRALIEHAAKTPHLFFWLNLHTFGGVFIRPLGHGPDSKMDQSDLALFRQVAHWGEEITGYPTVSGFEEFLYEPDKPLHGDLSDFAYHQRGCISYVVELWDLFARIGAKRPKKFVDYYTQLSRADLVALGRFDGEHNRSRAILPWRRFEHPQLGALEVGGLDPIVGFWNPPYELIEEVCRKHSAHFLKVASLAPRIELSSSQVALSGGLTRVELTVENRGYLPTWILSSAKNLSFNEPLWADVRANGCTLDDPGEAHREVGHLEGWGRGLHGDGNAVYFQRSRGSVSRKTLTWVVRGQGTIELTVSSCRTGSKSIAVEIERRA